MPENLSVVLVGAGAMGGALLRGWLENNVLDVSASAVFDPAIDLSLSAYCERSGLAVNPASAPGNVQYMVAAIKPQMAAAVLPAFSPIAAGAITISVMAGRSIATIETELGSKSRVVRAMPNLPAGVGAGITGIFADPSISNQNRREIAGLLNAVGETAWVETEDAIDWVTAISGSGPAYYFLLTEALQDAARSLGLSDDIAAQLARSTLIGSGAMAAQDPRTIQKMRMSVTSPGGTTAAALDIYEKEAALRQLVKSAVAAAANRATELTS